jgi:hypothetical protein
MMAGNCLVSLLRLHSAQRRHRFRRASYYQSSDCCHRFHNHDSMHVGLWDDLHNLLQSNDWQIRLRARFLGTRR